MEFPEARLIVLTKAPVSGEVKTRMVPALTLDQAVELHIDLVRHTLALVTQSNLCPVDLWCTPAASHSFFKKCRHDFGVSLHDQQGPDLGSRMHNAFKETLQTSQFAILIGTDCPVLTKKDLHETLTALRNGKDAILIPAEDGGYVLIGLRNTAADLFFGIRWSKWSVLHQTRTRLDKLGWQWDELPERWDVDKPADLNRLNKNMLTR